MGKNNKQKKEDRFAAAETRPQFRSLKQNQSKVVLDQRFTSVLTDSRFQLEGKDKYGRGGKRKQAVKEELSAFYTIEEDDERKKEVETDSESEPKEESPTNEDEKSDLEDQEKAEDPASRIAYLTAFSRGELDVSSSSEEEESSHSSEDDDGDEEDDPVYGSAGVLDPSAKKEEEVEITYDESPYLVATNLDWENIRAVDIFAIISSFAPPGAVKRVQVYQSDFGRERMTKDKLSGPTDIWKRKKVRKISEEDQDEQDEEESKQGSDHSNPDDSDADNSDRDDDPAELEPEESNIYDESDFDPEKLRAYEASKLKYYFAIVEFAKSEHADVAYREVDGMEFEHSSSAIDLRALPQEALDDVTNDRPMRDEATTVPSNYEPPDFVVSALQQTNVQCTWDQGDVEREKKLTKYGTGDWQNLSEADELKAYLASDASSGDESEDDQAAKGSNIRKLLGLDSEEEDNNKQEKGSHSGAGSSDDGSDTDEEGGKTLKYVPGAKTLQEKIRNKLESRDETIELTPWQKYQEKRKEKRRERKHAAKNRSSGHDIKSSTTKLNDSQESDNESDAGDDFFVETEKKSKRRAGIKDAKESKPSHSSGHELELLLAGENEEEEARDYDIRGIQRMEKNQSKKLLGSRKRKEDKITADISGKDFKVDIQDARFAAVLEGSDDRFGIDKTDPNYKDTSGMREILSQQTKRRKKKRKKNQGNDATAAVPDVNVEENAKSAGASALSALVQKLKTQVS